MNMIKRIFYIMFLLLCFVPVTLVYAYDKTIENIRWGTTSNDEKTVYWDAVEGATDYRFSVNLEGSNGTMGGYTHTNIVNLKCLLTTAGYGSGYYYASVSAMNGSEAITDYAYGPKKYFELPFLDTPSNIIVENGIVSWTNVLHANEYRIWVYDITNSQNKLLLFNVLTVNSYDISNIIEYGKNYKILVSALDTNHCDYSLSATGEKLIYNDVYIVKTLDEYKAVIANTDVKTIILGANIDITDIEDDTIIINGKDRTLNLNGYNLTTNSKKLNLLYKTNNKFIIEDSSSLQTGSIVTNSDVMLNTTSSQNINANIVINGGNFINNNDSQLALIKADTSKNNKAYLTINNGVFQLNNMFNGLTSDVSINIKKMTLKNSNNSCIASSGYYADQSIDKIIDNSISEVMIKGTYTNVVDDSEIIKSVVASSLEEIVIVNKTSFEIEKIELEKYIGYQDDISLPIVIKNVGTTDSLKVKNVDISDKIHFALEGDDLPIIAAGDMNNSAYKIIVKSGLSSGTYKSDIIVTDINNKKYTGTITFRVIRYNLNASNFSVKINNWTYGNTPATPTVKGNESGGNVVYEYKEENADDSTYTKTIPTDAGKYMIKATIEETDKYNAISKTSKFVIYRANNNPTVIMNNYSWDQTPSIPVITNNKSDGEITIEYKKYSDPDTSYVDIPPTSVGSYRVRVTIAESKNYYKKVVVKSFSVTKKNLSLSGIKIENKIYDGKPIRPTGKLIVQDNLYSSDDVVLLIGRIDIPSPPSYEFPTDVGQYIAVYQISDSLYQGSMVLNFSITKADPEYELPKDLNIVKDSKLSDIVLPEGFSWNDPDTVLTDLGNQKYKATYTPTDTSNYNVINDIDLNVYVKDIFKVDTSVFGENGSISEGIDEIIEQEEFKVVFTPDEGYMINKVLINGSKDFTDQVKNNQLVFKVLDDALVEVSYKKIPYNIVVINNRDGNSQLREVVEVLYGDDKKVAINVSDGYKLICVKVNDIDVTSNIADNAIELKEIKSNIKVEIFTKIIKKPNKDSNNQDKSEEEILPDIDKAGYKFILGANQEYLIGNEDGALFQVNAKSSLLDLVMIDGVVIDSDNYILTGTDITIVLTDSYLKTLSSGEHELKLIFSDKQEVITNFTLIRKKCYLWIIIVIILLLIMWYLKRRHNKQIRYNNEVLKNI